MRIIAGNYRGKKLISPTGAEIRPTSDRARESIFNILRSKMGFYNLKLLDLFCGTGAFGLEAMSQGFEEVCLSDKDTTLAAKNAALFTKEKEKIKVLRADATSMPIAQKQYNVVFMDAPYKKGLSELALAQLVEKNWLAKDAIIIVEIEKKEALSQDLPSLELIDERVYGINKFLFFEFCSTN